MLLFDSWNASRYSTGTGYWYPASYEAALQPDVFFLKIAPWVMQFVIFIRICCVVLCVLCYIIYTSKHRHILTWMSSLTQGGTSVQWWVLSSVPGPFCVVFARVLSRFSSFRSQSKDRHARLIAVSKLALGVSERASGSFPYVGPVMDGGMVQK